MYRVFLEYSQIPHIPSQHFWNAFKNSTFLCPVPPSYIKFIPVLRIFWVPWKCHNKFIMKWKRWWFIYYLVYAYIFLIFKIKVCRLSINVKVKFHSNIQKDQLSSEQMRFIFKKKKTFSPIKFTYCLVYAYILRIF